MFVACPMRITQQLLLSISQFLHISLTRPFQPSFVEIGLVTRRPVPRVQARHYPRLAIVLIRYPGTHKNGMGYNGIGEACFKCCVLFRWRLVSGQMGCTSSSKRQLPQNRPWAAQLRWLAQGARSCPSRSEYAFQATKLEEAVSLDQPIPWSGAESCPAGKEGQKCVTPSHPMGIHPKRDTVPKDHCFPRRSIDSLTLPVLLSLEAHPDLGQREIGAQHPKRVSP